jgi:type II secretory pathway pseudopilin PulG
MKQPSRQFAFPSAGDRAAQNSTGDGGYALLILLMLATVMIIVLSATLPSISTQGQREKEEELIFRGNEYARAIAMFRRQFRRFPTETKELLRTNGVRFLRREYRDPMTKSGKWRFVHADASGTPIDSRTIARPKASKPLGDKPSMFTDEREREKKESEPASESDSEKEKSSFFGGAGDLKGAFIIGVASTSNKNSIRVLNNKTRYSDWEFLGIEMGSGGMVPGSGGAGMPGGQTGGSGGGGFGGRPGFPGTPPIGGSR